MLLAMLLDDGLCHFDTMHEYDKQTDGWTNRWTVTLSQHVSQSLSGLTLMYPVSPLERLQAGGAMYVVKHFNNYTGTGTTE